MQDLNLFLNKYLKYSIISNQPLSVYRRNLLGEITNVIYYYNQNPNFNEITRQLDINKNLLLNIERNIVNLIQHNKEEIVKQFETLGNSVLSLSRIKGLNKNERNKLMSLINKLGLYWHNLANAYRDIGDDILLHGNRISNLIKNANTFYILENTENINDRIDINFLRGVIAREFLYKEAYPLDSGFIDRFFYTLADRYNKKDKYRIRMLIKQLIDYINSLPEQDARFRKEIERKFGKEYSYKNGERIKSLKTIQSRLLSFFNVNVEEYILEHEEP